jgi:hypothetical protein
MANAIKCPSCQSEIPLTDAIEHQIEERLAAQMAHEISAREKRYAAETEQREQELRREFEQAQTERERKLQAQAERRVATDLADLGARVAEQDAEIVKARERELELRKEKRALDEQKKELELEVGRRLDSERKKIAVEAREGAAEEHRLQLRQKEIEMEQMKRQIKDLQDSAEQVRAGLRGEAQEREIEDVLRERFRSDRIDPVKSGARGADVLQSVHSARGELCGTILWESKRARNFSNGWIPKLKEDQAAANADIAVLVSAVLPANVTHMELVDGVWIVSFACVAAAAGSLRQALINVAQARSIDANRNNALTELYDYLTSNEFNRRMRSAVETFIDMKGDLDTERRATERMWNKRAKQIDALAANTSGMYGELEGLIGGALPAVELLELPPAPPVALRPTG